MKKIIPRETIKKNIKQFEIKRVSDKAVEKLAIYLEDKLINIVRECLEYAKFAERTTLLKEDFELWKKKKLLKKF